ncbi:pyrroline-5-carboxylate reductase [Burkholderia sp. SRS-W-2-2016]|uniref:NAD(P)-binding domain-containing protein n=1 Tax=Burkholderia sp. SRS-W-2-2016 TaxID=1926878 RepID=UPI00094B2DF8|nr:NAD(P)-binding domain-containing protein [Burkholderia sp. SRS-W-2-2016]OLL27398.1 pyrroline-5-carboxylate reductase [Burkholderia sp. SRS-W-2-2016]
MIKLGILGVGDLTEKIVRGLLRAAHAPEILLSPRSHDKAQALARKCSCRLMPDNQTVVDHADIVLVGVRPAQLAELAQELVLKPKQKLISVVGGVSVDELKRLFGTTECVRAMLSYAAEINRSTVAIYPDEADARALLGPLGNLIALASETQFELATVGACMNGWFYFLLHDLQHWLVEKGLPADSARALVLSSVEDCAAYSRHRGASSMQDLGRSIATQGTFTAQGLEMLGLHQTNAAWNAACEVVFDALIAGVE